jgi:heptosyltransferase-2
MMGARLVSPADSRTGDHPRDASLAPVARRRRLRTVNDAMTGLLRAAAAAQERRDPAPIASAPRKVLFVKLVGLGDAVMVRSLAEHLQRVRPEVEIGMLGGPATADVLGALPRVTVHQYDPANLDRGLRAGLRVLRAIRFQAYDAVVDFEQHLAAIAMFLRATQIPIRIGLASGSHPRALFQTHTVELTGDGRMWDAYASLLRVLAPSVVPWGALPLRYSPATIASVDQWWTHNGLDRCRKIAAFHVGSGGRSAARRWPVDRFAGVAAALSGANAIDAVVLTGRPEERPLVEQFAGMFPGRTVDATGLGSVVMTAEVLRRCRVAISNDTGIMHLAAAMGTPTVGLFGPNTPARYAPVGPLTDSMYTTRVPCSPCINIHNGQVPECFARDTGRCMLDLDVSSVTVRVLALITQLDTRCA